jgi:epoxyqueuosine reductase
VTLETRLRDAGLAAGLAAVGFAAAEPFDATLVHLRERKAAGLHGGMQFTFRNPERSTTPTRILSGARSLVVGALGYRRSPPDLAPAAARIAAYAWDDYYGALKGALGVMADVLTTNGHRARIVADDNALVDREAAYRAGIGWYGKNTNLLLEGQGSWFVLGSIVTDAELAPDEPQPDGCGTCDRCRPACPTGALVEPGVLDARRCLAWLLQAEGEFPEQHRAALGDRIYGCDDCQEACPPNRRVDRNLEEAGQPVAVPEANAAVEIEFLLRASDDDLMARVGRWYIPRRDPRYLRRNALVVLGNLAAERRIPAATVEALLAPYLDTDDELLRTHAEWARSRQ